MASNESAKNKIYGNFAKLKKNYYLVIFLQIFSLISFSFKNLDVLCFKVRKRQIYAFRFQRLLRKNIHTIEIISNLLPDTKLRVPIFTVIMFMLKIHDATIHVLPHNVIRTYNTYNIITLYVF